MVGFVAIRLLPVLILLIGLARTEGASASEPCCSITAIDAKSGTITARKVSVDPAAPRSRIVNLTQ